MLALMTRLRSSKQRGLTQGRQHSGGDAFGILRAGHVVEQHDELVTPEPRQLIPLTQTGLEPLGDLHQHQIAHRMAETVVDQLEAIQVNEQQCRMAGTRTPQMLSDSLQVVTEFVAIDQSGQRIMGGCVLQLQLHSLAFADVGLRAGEPANSRTVTLQNAA